MLGAIAHVEKRWWMDSALCARSENPEWWFPADGDTAAAVRVCADCPVRADCLEYAIANRIKEGIWGGQTERGRRMIVRARRRAR